MTPLWRTTGCQRDPPSTSFGGVVSVPAPGRRFPQAPCRRPRRPSPSSPGRCCRPRARRRPRRRGRRRSRPRLRRPTPPARSPAAAPSIRKPAGPSAARSTFVGRGLAEDDVGGARDSAAVVVGVIAPDDHVRAAVAVHVSRARDRVARVVAGGRAVDPEARRPSAARSTVAGRGLAEDDVGRAGVRPGRCCRRQRADDHVGPAVPVHVARARDRAAGASPAAAPSIRKPACPSAARSTVAGAALPKTT